MSGDTTEQWVARTVAEKGWAALSISGNPSFVYTVGLMFSFGHPELVVFGLGREGHRLLAAIVQEIRVGQSFASGANRVVGELRVGLGRVDRSWHERYLGYAMGYCRERWRIGELEAVQIFWADEAGVLPHERGCDEAVERAQPSLRYPPEDDE